MVMDSWALMAFFQDEPAAKAVESLLIEAASGKVELLFNIVNWGEIYYSVARAHSRAEADKIAGEIAELPIEIVFIADSFELTRQAALYKAVKKMSYADCFAAALAKLRRAKLITGDHEFREVEDEIRVQWLR